jgi:hypothetical protein
MVIWVEIPTRQPAIGNVVFYELWLVGFGEVRHTG